MLFDSPAYLIFLVAVVYLYWRLSWRRQNILLLCASYFFYGWWDWRFLLLMMGSTVVDYLIANLNIKVEFFDGKPVGVELPQTVELTVVETEPGLKSATASSVTKPAKTETGLVVYVPPFINEGEKIRVDTSEGSYLSRA